MLLAAAVSLTVNSYSPVAAFKTPSSEIPGCGTVCAAQLTYLIPIKLHVFS